MSAASDSRRALRCDQYELNVRRRPDHARINLPGPPTFRLLARLRTPPQVFGLWEKK